jgi:hypothetical protein
VIVGVSRGVVLLVLCVASTTACHRFEPVNDVSAVAGVQGQLTLVPEARARFANRLGGVAMDVVGIIFTIPGDSIGIKADEVHFSDLGTVPFAQGEIRFAARDVAVVAKETLNRKKTSIVAVLVALGVFAVGIAFTPGSGVFGFGRTDPPTPR